VLGLLGETQSGIDDQVIGSDPGVQRGVDPQPQLVDTSVTTSS
jgi:hypothetical protein